MKKLLFLILLFFTFSSTNLYADFINLQTAETITIKETLIDTAIILFVDDDGSDFSSYEAQESKYTDVLDALGFTYDVIVPTTLGSDGPNLTTMNNYNCIIWNMGENWRDDNTLTANDETNLATWLKI